MSLIVNPDVIERIVGVPRDRIRHYARAVSAERNVYVLHSIECRTSGIDLRDCPFSLALDRGIDAERWPADESVHVVIEAGRLVPLAEPAAAAETPDEQR